MKYCIQMVITVWQGSPTDNRKSELVQRRVHVPLEETAGDTEDSTALTLHAIHTTQQLRQEQRKLFTTSKSSCPE